LASALPDALFAFCGWHGPAISGWRWRGAVVALLSAMFCWQPWRVRSAFNLIVFFVGVAGFCVFTGVPIAFGFGLRSSLSRADDAHAADCGRRMERA